VFVGKRNAWNGGYPGVGVAGDGSQWMPFQYVEKAPGGGAAPKAGLHLPVVSAR